MSRPTEPSQQQAKKAKKSDLLSPLRLHRLSTTARSSDADKGKTPLRGNEIYDSPLSTSQAENSFNNRDKFGFQHASSIRTMSPTRPTSAGGHRLPSTNLSRKRGSLLVAASDALGFRFGRKRQTVPARLPTTTTTFLPDIIEITAHHPADTEWEERERLREEAAQCLGISVEQDAASITQTTEENDLASHVHGSDNATSPVSTQPTGPDILSYSTNSLPSPIRPTNFEPRHSSSSMTHTRRISNPSVPIPSFPASVHALRELEQLSASLPKYYPPHSLRILALSKNWKLRYVVLTSPALPMTNNCEPAVSYLHIFKSSGTHEREIERLEINENSVVFIAEEDVGSRRHVVKVGGGCSNGGRNGQVVEDGRFMWFFHIPDSAESQKWITAIKNVIFAQRTIRAGLGFPSQVTGGIEPRGDMDVMLSIRQQGIVTVPSNLRQSAAAVQSVDPIGTYASSISSQSIKSQTTGPKTPPSTHSPSGALKSLFISRSRATSRATSLDSEKENDSYLSMSQFMNKLRPSTGDSKKSSEHSFVPPLSTFMSAPHALQRKIVKERPPDSLPSKAVGDNAYSRKAGRPLSLGSSSLQPPPRKRRGSEAIMTGTTSTVPTIPDETIVASIPQSPQDSPPNNRFSHFGSPKLRPRVQSAQSVSTIASGDNTTSQERSSISTKRSSKRWSRQSVLPARPNPPNGPPPPAPQHLQPHPYGVDQTISRTPSNQSDKSFIPGFASLSSKRASTASAFSVKSTSSQSPGTGTTRSSRPSSSHRSSIPPSKPAPTSALPPAPTSSLPQTKSSFKDSVAVRVGRLSVVAPKPVPTTALPPAPDQRQINAHRRASSESYFTKLANPNPSTPSLTFVQTQANTAPLPPPSPLPSTPKPTTLYYRHSLASPTPLQNDNIILRRLRMLSTPTPPAVDENIHDVIPATEPSRPRSNTVTSPIVQAPKPIRASLVKSATPIAEKIISFQDDPSILQFDTPTIHPLRPPRALQQTADQPVGMTSLSPPPRRGSRQLFPAETAEPDSTLLSTPTPKPLVMDDERLISLSRPGSVPLGIVNM